tara:strand:+ start:1647 stop:1988 length:342 start_codon:yes stop_codon:yes gene_type:complete
MESTGVPISVLWSAIGVLGSFVYVGDRKNNKERFEKIEKDVRLNSKELSKEELKELEEIVQKEMKYFLTSDDFRSGMKTMMTEAINHSKKNDIAGQIGSLDLILEEIKKLKNK